MTTELRTPGPDELGEVLGVLGSWQSDDTPLQLHPGDLGWAWRFGAAPTAATVRTWVRDGDLVAAGVADGDELVRLTTAPGMRQDLDLADRLVQDLDDPGAGVLGAGSVAVEVPTGALVRELLTARGWRTGEAWAPLRRDLADPVEEAGARVEVVGPDQAPEWIAVHQSAFGSTRTTVEAWRTMAAGPAYAAACSLLARDDDGRPVATVTVWSAGPGRPGLLEPLGVHADHRGRGFGRAISLAAAAALRDLGSCSALVCTPSANVGGVATYRSAGFEALTVRHDLRRDG